MYTCPRLEASLSSRGLGLRVFIPATGVRIPLGMPFFSYFEHHSSAQALNSGSKLIHCVYDTRMYGQTAFLAYYVAYYLKND